MNYAFSFVYIVENLPVLFDGFMVTVRVSVISIAIASLIGIAGAAVRLLKVPVLSQVVGAYVHFIRSTPLLPQIFFIFYGLASVGLPISSFWAGVFALSLWGGAYNVENVRGGFLSISKGLHEAADSLAFGPLHYLWLVAVPLGVRVSLPSMLNTSVSVLKNSAYLQAIGLAELTFVAMDKVSLEFRTLEMFAAIGVMYLVLVLALSIAVRRLENVLQKPFRP
ncbi:amino acid ABC transporter permease [Chelativorans sp. YIM 93263]|uniref:amino acid ABC transporter permease n=1 Tax=Chelativorans sp. YIM 93263 TaxID=2906648 RepID=UPI002378E116|nr:amino acid ABC transporter permease [Chelativorans sp. YIM 93263]